ncbi:MAG: spermidine synthase, partial [Myxococcota bacterium]
QAGPNPGSLCFPVVLAVYLSGLVVGGLASGRIRRERRALGLSALLAGGVTVAVMALLPLIPEERLLGHIVGEGPGNVFFFHLTGLQVSADRLLIYLAAVFVPGVASGVGFPLAAQAMARAEQGLGRGVGLTSAAGISAAVGVSLWMGFLPSFGPGSVRLTVLLGLTALVAGAILLRSPASGLLAVLGCGALWVPPWAGLQIPPGETVLAFVETAAGPSAVTEGAEMPLVYTHGERVGGLQLDLEYPMALHPDPARVLVIAFGTGMNIRGFSRDPAITELTCVDIDPALPELGAHIPQTGADLFDGERVRFVNADGRHLLQQAGTERWDIIYSDVATYAQYVELGTVEFFSLARSRLSEGGIFTLKLHPDTLTEEGLQRFLATFLSVFPDAAMFAKNNPVPVLVGFTGGAPSLDVMQMRGEVSGGLYGPHPEQMIPRNLQLGPTGLSTLASGRLATDDRPLSLRHALVGPLTSAAVERASLPLLISTAREHGERASGEVFGVKVRRNPWGARSFPLRPRRGWLEEEDPRLPPMMPPPPRRR